MKCFLHAMVVSCCVISMVNATKRPLEVDQLSDLTMGQLVNFLTLLGLEDKLNEVEPLRIKAQDIIDHGLNIFRRIKPERKSEFVVRMELERLESANLEGTDGHAFWLKIWEKMQPHMLRCREWQSLCSLLQCYAQQRGIDVERLDKKVVVESKIAELIETGKQASSECMQWYAVLEKLKEVVLAPSEKKAIEDRLHLYKTLLEQVDEAVCCLLKNIAVFDARIPDASNAFLKFKNAAQQLGFYLN